MASMYLDMRDFIKAKRSVSDALDLCPTSSSLWAKQAEIQFAQNQKEAADSSCRRALLCDPGNFRARDLMRECEGKENVFKNFPQEDIKEIIRTAPSSSSFPNDPAVVLLDDNRRVLYTQGATEYEREMLVRVFNSRGIEMMKEYGIEYNGSEDLIVEKAVVIKKNGYEIKADVDDGHVVFKTLEPDDFVYMKWKLRQTGINMVTTMFNDNILFNGHLPLRLIRYSVLVPPGLSFTHRTFNMEDHPVVRKTGEGDLYEWSASQEPALSCRTRNAAAQSDRQAAFNLDHPVVEIGRRLVQGSGFHTNKEFVRNSRTGRRLVQRKERMDNTGKDSKDIRIHRYKYPLQQRTIPAIRNCSAKSSRRSCEPDWRL